MCVCVCACACVCVCACVRVCQSTHTKPICTQTGMWGVVCARTWGCVFVRVVHVYGCRCMCLHAKSAGLMKILCLSFQLFIILLHYLLCSYVGQFRRNVNTLQQCYLIWMLIWRKCFSMLSKGIENSLGQVCYVRFAANGNTIHER